jgi:hypothetical protein
MRNLLRIKETGQKTRLPIFLDHFLAIHAPLVKLTTDILAETKDIINKPPQENIQDVEMAIFKIRDNPDPIIAICIDDQWYSLFEWE